VNRGVQRALLVLAFAAAILAVLQQVDTVRQGLTGRYYAALDSRAAPAHTRVDAPPSSARFGEVWGPGVPQTFSATWDGALFVWREGRYTFATISDDASFLHVDGTVVVDNGDAHAPLQRTGTMFLSRGLHAIHLSYDQRGGGYDLQWLWARESEPLEPVPAWRMATRRVSTARFLASQSRRVAGRLATGALAIVAGAAAIFWLWTRAVRLRVAIARDGSWRSLRWVLLGSFVLNAAGIWWGLPGNWPAAELTPKLVAKGEAMWFAHGWYDAYPPLHFYLVTLAALPLRFAQWMEWTQLPADLHDGAVLLIFRSVSLVFSLGIVISVWWLGRRAFGRQAGVYAAACFAVVTPFVYYAKTANTDVPYLFWFALSMVCYVRSLDALRMKDFVLFALAATLSVCSKDQAYGLYVLMPLPIVLQLWRANRAADAARPFVRALIDGRLWAAAATAVVAFALCHNLLFNWRGFITHVNFIVGPGSADYRVFDPTLDGHVQLLRLTLWLIQQSLGWPLTVAAALGVVRAATQQKHRAITAWLLLPAVSYYLTFIDVILYNYDRFVLPICLVLAPFAGLAVHRTLTWPMMLRPVRQTVVAAGLAYTVLYAATVDVLMIGDSRYVIEAWLAPRVRAGDLVASTFPPDYLPRLEKYGYVDIGWSGDLEERRPAFYVLNVDYARAAPLDTRTGRLVEGLHAGTLGYRRVFEYRRPSPWPWLPGGHHDLVGPRLESRVATILRNVNPTIAVFERVDR
jgi:4-amino-4-deoxy-L-arabinose transferase-like glycosyltransferase